MPASTAAPGWPPARLADPVAREQQLAGAKAARLADALAQGLPVLDGWVLPVPFACKRLSQPEDAATTEILRLLWREVAAGAPVVVRSSAPGEDGAEESNAGRFTSVLGVGTEEEFVDAVDAVVASAGGEPMAVLVQPELRPQVSGVLFGVHPVTGDPRPLLALVAGSPAPLVSGEVDGTLLVLGRRGVLRDDTGDKVDRLHDVPVVPLARRLRHLADRCAELFGGPQDIEWALDRGGRLWLLQSRPVTRTALRVDRRARLLGPGPVAETLPLPLWPLEADLWVRPLDAGLAGALAAAGAPVPAEGVVRVVASRAVADLTALGVVSPARRSALVRLIDPRPALHRTAVAWRVARLRVAWPTIAADLVVHLDQLLAEVPPLTSLDDGQLLGLLDSAGLALVSAHGYEALAGLVLDPTASEASAAATTAASVALARLAAGSCDAAADPVLLALVPPSIEPVPLPPAPPPLPSVVAPAGDAGDPALLREALRLRARWLQELQARTARELGRRLALRGGLDDERAVRELTRAELTALVTDATAVHRPDPSRVPAEVSLPSQFRLDPAGEIVAAQVAAGGGTPAGGGRAAGVVVHRGQPIEPGVPAVLVVDVLDPALAAELPKVVAIVAATGSPLSHLAILAREYGVATVVALPDATTRLPAGTPVTVDGRSGEVIAS